MLSEGSRTFKGGSSFPVGLTIRIVGVSLSAGGEIRGHAVQRRMTLGLDCQVLDEFVAVLDPVFEEKAVADGNMAALFSTCRKFVPCTVTQRL